MADRSVLIVGTNTKKYLDFALNCAESVRLHNPNLKIFIATNIIPKEPIQGIEFIEIEEKIAKLFIEVKLYIDTFLQTEETLYIDSDMLCFGNLNPVFDLCNAMDVTVLGKPVKLEDYWGEEGAIFARENFNIDQSILFNGGLYYLKKTPLTTKIYNEARKLSEKYDEYGFIRIQNNWKNEEELVSVAMTASHQRPIDDGGIVVAGFSKANEFNDLNVLTGKIKKPKAVRPNTSRYAIKKSLLFHFGGNNMSSKLYRSQIKLLKLHKAGISIPIASIMISLTMKKPYQFYLFVKNFRNKWLKKI